MQLDQATQDKLKADFDEKDHDFVIAQLLTITTANVMAKSENLLAQTRFSILNLAKGDIKEVQYFVKCAKTDFRDVIYWNSAKYKRDTKKKND